MRNDFVRSIVLCLTGCSVIGGCGRLNLPLADAQVSLTDVVPVTDAGRVDASEPDAETSALDATPGDAGGDAAQDAPFDADPITYTPSNVGTRAPFALGTVDLDIGADAHSHWVVYTDDGRIIKYTDLNRYTGTNLGVRAAGTGDDGSGIVHRVLTQTGGGDPLAVFAVRSVRIRESASLRAVGRRPFVLIVGDSITVEGRLSVAANSLGGELHAGAGGGSGGSAGEAGGGPGGGRVIPAVDPLYPGGAGGSFGTRGGAGGTTGTCFPTAAPPYGNVMLSPLLGGSGGGGGGGVYGRGGGAGGGALQVSAQRSIVIADTGVIDAAGGGGHGISVGPSRSSGSGAGSGGGVLLEAPTVTVRGFIGANGGGGGSASSGGFNLGEAGKPDIVPALGGRGADMDAAGGAGSNADGDPRPGLGACTNQNLGGGGGAGGRVRINTATGTDTFPVGILPLPSSGLSTVGRLSP